MNRIFALVALVMVIGWTVAAHAILIDRGGGLIYDSDLNVTHLQQFGLNTVDLQALGFATTDATITFYQALDAAARFSFVDSVRSTTWDDWRLPFAPVPDSSCTQAIGNDFFGCTGNELGYLYFVYGIKTGNQGIFGQVGGGGIWVESERHVQGQTIQDAYEFSFLQNDSVSQPTSNPGGWLQQGFNPSVSQRFVMLVRDGDVGAVPEPGTLLLLGSGLVGLAACRKRLRRSRN